MVVSEIQAFFYGDIFFAKQKVEKSNPLFKPWKRNYLKGRSAMLPMVLPPGASISEWKGPDMVLMNNYKMMVLLDKAVSLPTVRSGES